jgi:drug/metabolite transporter (DMT)-like permease
VGDTRHPHGAVELLAAIPDDRRRLRHRWVGDRTRRHRPRARRLHEADRRLARPRHLRPVRLPRPLLLCAPPAEAHLVSSLWALLIVLFSALLPGHRLRLNHVAGALLGLAAATLLVWPRLGAITAATSSSPGFLLALGCALVWSSYSVASRLLAAVPSESLAVSCLCTSAIAAVCTLFFETWVAPPTATAWAALIALGAGPVGAAFLLWDIGMKQGDTSLLGVLAYASPVISTALLVALGLAVPTWTLAAACALMVAAAAIATRQ